MVFHVGLEEEDEDEAAPMLLPRIGYLHPTAHLSIGIKGTRSCNMAKHRRGSFSSADWQSPHGMSRLNILDHRTGLPLVDDLFSITNCHQDPPVGYSYSILALLRCQWTGPISMNDID